MLYQRGDGADDYAAGGDIHQSAVVLEDLRSQGIDPFKGGDAFRTFDGVMQVLIDLHVGGDLLHHLEPLFRESDDRYFHCVSPLAASAAR